MAKISLWWFVIAQALLSLSFWDKVKWYTNIVSWNASKLYECLLEKAWILALYKDPALWQCSFWWQVHCPVVVGYLPYLGTCWLTAVPKTEDHCEWPQIFIHCQSDVKTVLKSILDGDFQEYFEQWKHWLTKCSAAQGDHLEGNRN
jgi:hypothetical protein